jgi:signal transduction histidine kinase
MIGLAEIAALAVPPAVAVAVALAVERRRRIALNRALHELRRPLQCLALLRSAPAGTRDATRASGSAQLDAALTALADLDAEINRRRAPGSRRRLRADELVGEAFERWRWPATLLGRELELHWAAGRATVLGDAGALSRALDNLVANSLEHGGTRVRLEGRAASGRLRIAVIDDVGPKGGAGGTLAGPPGTPPVGTRDPRHGHGLALSAGIACAHGGRLALSRRETGTRAVMELPLALDSPPARERPGIAA